MAEGKHIFKIKLLPLLSGILGVLILSQCASKIPEAKVYQYRFSVGEKEYKIRSIILYGERRSYNELISDSFVAMDYDQDQYIDRIRYGDESIAQAQVIYREGLKMLDTDGKLQFIYLGNEIYKGSINGYNVELRFINPDDDSNFIEIRFLKKNDSDKQSMRVHAAFIDRHADGILNEVVRGDQSIDTFQSYYSDFLTKALRAGGISKQNGMYLKR